MHSSKYITLIFLLGLIAGCGGSETSSRNTSSPGNNNETSGNNNSDNNTQPTELSAGSFSRLQPLSQENSPILNVATEGDTISMTISNIRNITNYQFHLNSDNNDETGYIYDKGVFWDNAGSDYLIENGNIFKSKSNGSSWNWELISGNTSELSSDSSLTIKVKQSMLEGLSPRIRAGFLNLDADWQIISATPLSARLAEYSLDIDPSTDDTTPPSITILGSQVMEITKGSKFQDPGATATDNIDGDLTTSISVKSDVDSNMPGNYTITYSVKDAAGNTATAMRKVTVVETQDESTITIDGNTSDWANINAAYSDDDGYIKVTSNTDKLYFLIQLNQQRPNQQILLDIDMDAATGYQTWLEGWKGYGIDYMIENNKLNRYAGKGSEWSWEYDIANIDYIKNENTIELAIPRNSINHTDSAMSIGVTNIDHAWAVQERLPKNGFISFVPEQSYIADRKDFQLFGDPQKGRIVGMQMSTMEQVLDLPVRGENIYSSDIIDDTKSYAYARRSNLITVIRRDAQGNFTATREIDMPFAPRTGAKNKALGVTLITGAERPMHTLINTFTDKIVTSGGRNEETFQDASNHGSKWATGHGVWLTDTYFVVPDRQARKISLYEVNPETFEVTERDHLFTDSSVHTVIGKRNNEDGIYYAVTEGANDAKPGLYEMKLEADNGYLYTTRIVKVAGDDPTIMKGHHAGFHPNGIHIYMGSAEGILNIIDRDSLKVVKTIPAGKGAGHTTWANDKGLAIITNHSDTFVTVINTNTNEKVKDITVSGVQKNGSSLQSHTARLSPNQRYYYNFATDNGYYFRVDLDKLEMDKTYYTGGTPKQASQPGEVN